MLTKDDIKKHLLEDPFWEPDEDATADEWDLYEEAYNEISEDKSLNKGVKDKQPEQPEDLDSLDDVDELDDDDFDDDLFEDEDDDDDDDNDY